MTVKDHTVSTVYGYITLYKSFRYVYMSLDLTTINACYLILFFYANYSLSFAFSVRNV